jgi:hypothetical protein
MLQWVATMGRDFRTSRIIILSKLEAKFGNNQIGLYRDDGLAILKARRARSADKARKELYTLFFIALVSK